MPYIGKSPEFGVRQRYYFTQSSGGGTSVSGTDDNGITLKFSDGNFVDVFLNGVLLVDGTDYGTSTANTISNLSAMASGDVVEVLVYDVFNIAKNQAEVTRTRYYKTASGGETSISGNDDSGVAIQFEAGAQLDVSLNGVSLVAGSDYNTSTANTISGLSALTAGNVIEIVKYEKFVISDTVSKAAGGTFGGAITATSFSGDGSALTGVSAGKVLQFASDQSAIGSGSTNMPQDNTTPTTSEGTEIFSLAFTPTAATSNLLIQMNCQMSSANNTVYIVWALFEDSTCIGAWSNTSAHSNSGCIINFNIVRAASSTSARTYSVRAGRSSGTSGTYYYGYVTSNSYGQLNQNYMTILEIGA
tara:strand:+ start:481 stop:1557 length:1077 start_codon:yes stop_codon:yes gene_type:complete